MWSPRPLRCLRRWSPDGLRRMPCKCRRALRSPRWSLGNSIRRNNCHASAGCRRAASFARRRSAATSAAVSNRRRIKVGDVRAGFKPPFARSPADLPRGTSYLFSCRPGARTILARFCAAIAISTTEGHACAHLYPTQPLHNRLHAPRMKCIRTCVRKLRKPLNWKTLGEMLPANNELRHA
jgi:hypothetical protein